jgi:Tfp pilus assembly protein PilF
VLTVEGTNVWIQRSRSQQRESAYPQQILEIKDHGYTGARSRATLRLSDLSVARISEQSEFEIEALPDKTSDGGFSLLRGLLYLLHRDRPGSHRFTTPTATAATRGTEFTLEVEAGTGRTLLTVLEGEAELSNAAGTVILASGEQGIAVLGQAPTKTAVLDTTNLVQWCLYYPGTLDVSELALTPQELDALEPSLAAYRSGDLLKAAAAYPSGRTAVSDDESLYAAGLFLAFGQVAEAEPRLAALVARTAFNRRPHRLAASLLEVIAAVKRRAVKPAEFDPDQEKLATERLAESYTRQGFGDLAGALAAARDATRRSPHFGFAWVRVAELAFGDGNTAAARNALERGLQLSPRNAQALALRGFLLAAENRTGPAIESFEQAMSIDGGLGNAWLGRGLCRIRRGDAAGGRFDLQVAATLEPQRSLLRSYLGKAFSNAGDTRRAARELELARQIDAGDPTPWLYSALLLQQENRLNEAVRELEHSKELNDNRQIYRSRLALDQDRSVRSANQANTFRDLDMSEVSVREAGRAVSADYANDSAHQFLADSFDQLLDPRRVNRRYETAWFSEYLLANLLAPVGASALSRTVSQQEYSRLFEQDRLGVASSTEYFSHGEWFENAAQFGNYRNLSYVAEVSYHHDRGWRPNNDVEELTALFILKYQLTPHDTVFIRTGSYSFESGDPSQYYQQSQANPGLRTQDRQDPLLLAGYHHEWSPASHTLMLFGRLQDVYKFQNPNQHTWLFIPNPAPVALPLFYGQNYRSEQEIYSGELQQIWQRDEHALVVGGRWQAGEFQVSNHQTNGQAFNGTNFTPVAFPIDQSVSPGFQHGSAYAYDNWQAWETLLLVGGLTYDWIQFPENYRYGPVSSRTETRDQLSPKAGLIFTPTRDATLRAGWFRALGGADLDQSYRLEPSQIAGFNQAYRSLIPESVAGSSSAPEMEGWAVSLEHKWANRTFAGISGEWLSSRVNRSVGNVEFAPPVGPGLPFSAEQTREHLDFDERTLLATLNQLVGTEWSFGVRYRLSQADLTDHFAGIPSSTQVAGGFEPRQDVSATLQQLQLSALYNHPSGFFAGAAALWSHQRNEGYSPDLPGDDFWQFNLEAGWRLFRRHVELRAALLNLTSQNYRLNPLNLTAELPRQRELALSLSFLF